MAAHEGPVSLGVSLSPVVGVGSLAADLPAYQPPLGNADPEHRAPRAVSDNSGIPCIGWRMHMSRKLVQDGPWPEDTPREFQPSVNQFGEFNSFIDWEAGVAEDGWWMGRCPLGGEHGAMFSFDRGAMKCQGDPSCHAPKRAMSISNVLKALTAR